MIMTDFSAIEKIIDIISSENEERQKAILHDTENFLKREKYRKEIAKLLKEDMEENDIIILVYALMLYYGTAYSISGIVSFNMNDMSLVEDFIKSIDFENCVGDWFEEN